MAFTDVFGTKESEDAGGFDENESEDLSLHVRQCGRRYRALDRKLTMTLRLVMLLVAINLLTSSSGALQTVVKLLTMP